MTTKQLLEVKCSESATKQAQHLNPKDVIYHTRLNESFAVQNIGFYTEYKAYPRNNFLLTERVVINATSCNKKEQVLLLFDKNTPVQMIAD
jgi:hypothetical protein